MLTLEKEENQTFGFEIQVGEKLGAEFTVDDQCLVHNRGSFQLYRLIIYIIQGREAESKGSEQIGVWKKYFLINL